MKRLFKILGILLGVALLVILAFVLFVQFSALPTYEGKSPDININPDSAKIAEGERIVNTLCAGCHLSDDRKLGGRPMIDASAFGDVHSTNITNHPVHGALSKYSDGELAYLIRTGIKRDGTYAPPWMVKLPKLSDYDMEAIISYLRSDARPLQASNNANVPTTYNFLSKMLIKTKAFKPLPYPEGPVSAPDPSDRVEYGKYLALSKYDCFACHSKSFAKCDYLDPENSVGFMGGGNPIPDLDGNIILSANLTMDKETGIGSWSESDFIRAVQSGIRPDRKIANRYPMLPYTLLTDDELSAIYAYLKTIPVINNPKEFSEPAS